MGLLSNIFGFSNKLSFSSPQYSTYLDLEQISKSDRIVTENLIDMMNVYVQILYKSIIHLNTVTKKNQNDKSFINQVALEYTLFIWSASVPFMKKHNVSRLAGLAVYYSLKEAAYKVLITQIRESYYENFDKLIKERNLLFDSFIDESARTGVNKLLDYAATVFAYPLEYVQITKPGEIPLVVNGMDSVERIKGFEILRLGIESIPKEVTHFLSR